MEVVEAVIEDQGGNASVERRRSRNEVSTHAVPEQRDAVIGDFLPSQRIVDDRSDNRLPVRAENQTLLP